MPGTPQPPQEDQPQQAGKPRGQERTRIIAALAMGIAVAGICHAAGLPWWAQFLAAMAVIAAAGKLMSPRTLRQPDSPDSPPPGPPPEPPQQQ